MLKVGIILAFFETFWQPAWAGKTLIKSMASGSFSSKPDRHAPTARDNLRLGVIGELQGLNMR
jgi:hypothetical protein